MRYFEFIMGIITGVCIGSVIMLHCLKSTYSVKVKEGVEIENMVICSSSLTDSCEKQYALKNSKSIEEYDKILESFKYYRILVLDRIND